MRILGLQAFLLLVFATGVLALSTDDVLSIAKVYGSNEKAIIPPAEMATIVYKEVNYSYAYLTPQDSSNIKNLVIVVRAGIDGKPMLETDEAVLQDLYAIDYDKESLSTLQSKGIGFDDLKNVIDSLKYQLTNQESPILENIKKQSTEDFTTIDDALATTESAADDTVAVIQDGIAEYYNFKTMATSQEITPADVGNVLAKYDESVSSLQAFFGKAEGYQKAVADKQSELIGKPIGTELAKLGNLKVKDSVIQSYNASLVQKLRDFNLRKTRKQAAISDEIQSLFGRKAKVEATAAYQNGDNSLIETLISSKNEPSLKDCKLSNTDLKRKWTDVKYIMDPTQPHSTADYERVPSMVLEARQTAENLNNRWSACISATPTPTKQPQGFDFGSIGMPLVFLIVLVLAAYYLNNFMKKRPDDGVQE